MFPLLFSLVVLCRVTYISASIASTMQCNQYYYQFPTKYVTTVPNVGKNRYLDSVRHDFFKIDTVPPYYQAYYTRIYVDGSVETTTFLVIARSQTRNNLAAPSCTFTDTLLYTNGDMGVISRHIDSGNCTLCDGSLAMSYPVLAVSSCPRPLNTSQLAQVREVLTDNGLHCHDLRALPMRFINRGVTSQSCTFTGQSADCKGTCY